MGIILDFNGGNTACTQLRAVWRSHNGCEKMLEFAPFDTIVPHPGSEATQASLRLRNFMSIVSLCCKQAYIL